jgi:DNA-binding MarR family transcriptional regulator
MQAVRYRLNQIDCLNVYMHDHANVDNPQFPLEDDCFAVRQAARYVTQLYDRHLGQVGLKISQFSILYRLRGHLQMSMKQLAEAMVMDRTTLVRAIQPLQRDGLVMSESAPSDRRAVYVRLTQAGETRLRDAIQHWHAAQHDLEQRFGAQRAQALRDELFEMTRT